MSDHINIGDTVDVHETAHDASPWLGEVLDFVGDSAEYARVRPIDAGRDVVATVTTASLTRAGLVEWPWREHDGCDDVDVTGRVRPYHRHATTGEAHAHPGGGESHTHTSQPGFEGASIGPRSVDPVGRLVNRLIWAGDQGSAERSIRLGLADVLADGWRLVQGDAIDSDSGYLIRVRQEWTP